MEPGKLLLLLKAWSLWIQETLLQIHRSLHPFTHNRFILIEHMGPGNLHALAEKTEGAKSWEALYQVPVLMGPVLLFSLPSPSPVEL